MTRSSGKKKRGTGASEPASIKKPVKPRRPGAPDPDSILSEKVFKSPKGRVYKIIRTDEMDAYDKPLAPKDRRK